jgi:predicted nucleic acid-binding protein
VGLIAAVFYDTWAWREVAQGTAVGQQLAKEYGPDGPAEIHTSILALAEAGSVIARSPKLGPQFAEVELRRMESKSRVHSVEIDDVYAAVRLHPELRRVAEASLADALMLSQARRLRLPFITGGPAFRGQAGVPQEWVRTERN